MVDVLAGNLARGEVLGKGIVAEVQTQCGAPDPCREPPSPRDVGTCPVQGRGLCMLA